MTPTRLRPLLFLIGLLPLLAFAGWLDKEIAFSEADVQAAIDKSTVREARYGDLVAVNLLAPPKISLGSPQPERAGIVAQAGVSLLGARAFPVDFTGTAGIRYDDNSKAFYLDNPTIDTLTSPILGPDMKPAARSALNGLLRNYLRTRPVHVLRENGSAQEAAARWLLRSVRIENGKVVATLSPL